MSAFDQTDWLTVSVASIEYGIPPDLLEQKIIAGELEVRRVCGARVVRHSELCNLAKQIRMEMMRACCDES